VKKVKMKNEKCKTKTKNAKPKASLRKCVLWFLVFSFNLLVIFPLLSSCKRQPGKAERVERVRKKAAAKAAIAVTEIKEEKFLYASHDMRDPFVPLMDKKGRPVSVVEGGLQFKASDLFLEGIMWDDRKPMAIINDEIVSAGDKIKGMTVIKIEKNKVILSYQNEEFELRIE
jgi:hypothetical protein